MSTLDLKQNPPRRICTHVFAASHDATCSECYRGIWLPLSLPCSKMFFLPFRLHEMLQSLVQIFTAFWTALLTLLTPEQQLIFDVMFWNDWGLGQVSFNSTICGIMVGLFFLGMAYIRLLVLWGNRIKTKIVFSISRSILPYGSGKASHTTSDETVMVKRNTATSEESKQLICFPSLSGATNFLEIEVGKAAMNDHRTIDQPWNSAQKSWRLSTVVLNRTNSNDEWCYYECHTGVFQK